MAKERIYLFDTTLRDGAQTQGVDFSVQDKHTIAQPASLQFRPRSSRPSSSPSA